MLQFGGIEIVEMCIHRVEAWLELFVFVMPEEQCSFKHGLPIGGWIAAERVSHRFS